MGVGTAGNHHGADAAIAQCGIGIADGGAVLFCQRLGRRRMGIHHVLQAYALVGKQVGRMDLADASGAKQGYFNHGALRVGVCYASLRGVLRVARPRDREAQYMFGN